MGSANEKKMNTLVIGLGFCTTLVFLGLLPAAFAGAQTTPPDIAHYKMISTLEYTGQGQFRNQLETFLTVNRQPLSDGETHYVIAMTNPGMAVANQNSGRAFPKEVSFNIENGRLVLEANQDVAFLGQVSNLCTKSLMKVTCQDVGRTWNRSFELPLPGDSSAGKLNFTMTAMAEKKEPLGEMIAVRAMSEPFTVNVTGRGGVSGIANSRINTVYLFDSAVENVYLSISVFQAVTNVNGFREIFRNELAVYKTDASGIPVDLRGVSNDFARFASKVGLSSEGLKISGKTDLPQWVKSEGVRNVQMANVCSAIACEGALNPVSALSIPAASVLEYQKNGDFQLYTADAQLAAKTASPATAKAASPNIFQQITSNWGWNLPTAAVVGGVTAGGIAAGGGFGGGGGSSSTPASP